VNSPFNFSQFKASPYLVNRSQGSSVVQRWAMGWMIGRLCPSRGWEFFSLPSCPDGLCGPPRLLSNRYQG